MNAPSNADALAQLRDIHLPPPVSAWPPAPGWWLLAALGLALVIALTALLLRRRRRNRYRRTALRELRALRAQAAGEIAPQSIVAALNRLLKRTALAAYPQASVAALSGADWLLFLDAGLKQPRFSETDLRALANVYRPSPQLPAAQPLFAAAEYWIRRHRC